MKNLPHKNFYGDALFGAYPDDTPSRDRLKQIQIHINKIWSAIEWELTYNITFILANLPPATQQALLKREDRI